MVYSAQPLMLKKACWGYKRIMAYGLLPSRRRVGVSRDCFGRWEPGTMWDVVWRSTDGLLISVTPCQMPRDLSLPTDETLPVKGVIGSSYLAPTNWFAESQEEALALAEKRMYAPSKEDPTPAPVIELDTAPEVKETRYFQGVLEFLKR